MTPEPSAGWRPRRRRAGVAPRRSSPPSGDEERHLADHRRQPRVFPRASGSPTIPGVGPNDATAHGDRDLRGRTRDEWRAWRSTTRDGPTRPRPPARRGCACRPLELDAGARAACRTSAKSSVAPVGFMSASGARPRPSARTTRTRCTSRQARAASTLLTKIARRDAWGPDGGGARLRGGALGVRRGRGGGGGGARPFVTPVGDAREAVGRRRRRGWRSRDARCDRERAAVRGVHTAYEFLPGGARRLASPGGALLRVARQRRVRGRARTRGGRPPRRRWRRAMGGRELLTGGRRRRVRVWEAAALAAAAARSRCRAAAPSGGGAWRAAVW